MSTQTTTAFDLDALARAIEQRDASAQLALYAPDAKVTVVDRISQPGSPRVLRSRSEVEAWIQDICSRDMSHAVKHAVQDDAGAGFVNVCRYPDGTNVLCATLLEHAHGLITEQTVVQAWDES